MTEACRILSSNVLTGAFEVRCVFRNPSKAGNKQVIAFPSSVSRERIWKLYLLCDDYKSSPHSPKRDTERNTARATVGLRSLRLEGNKYTRPRCEMWIRKRGHRNDTLSSGNDGVVKVINRSLQMSRKKLKCYISHGELVVRVRMTFPNYETPKEYDPVMHLCKSIDGHLCDFDIVTPYGSLRVFKNVLCLRWPHFNKMISAECEMKMSSEWLVEDVSYETMKTIVVYVYTNAITLNDQEDVMDLAKAAHRYQLDDLLNACENYLIWDIDTKDVLELLLLSDLCELSELKETCSVLISKVLVSNEFAKLPGYERFSEYVDHVRLTQECFQLASKHFNARKNRSRKRKLEED
ncbi:Protein maternal effect lethal 26 [Halotydeus destructor]|nr:Protein maternal effect lethal 26 [Halotydeus destructor]